MKNCQIIRTAVAILALFFPVVPLLASPPDEATIVYDVKLREFVCWREGLLTNAARDLPCAAAEHWHPITKNLYFVRAQFVSILIVNGVAQDLFGVDVKADDLTEPSVPISGSFSELPKLLAIPSAPTVLPGSNVALAAGVTPVMASQLYRLLASADDASFKSWLKSNLTDNRLNAKEVTDFLAFDLERTQLQLTPIPTFIQAAQDLQRRLNTIEIPTTTEDLVTETRAMALLVDSESGLKGRLTVAGLAGAGKAVSDALSTLRSTPLQRALAVNPQDFAQFTSDFVLAFPDEFRYGRMDAITITADRFAMTASYRESGNPPAGMDDFLARLTQQASHPLNADTTKRLNANLHTLADTWSDILAARDHRVDLETIQQALRTGPLTNPDVDTSIFGLQRKLNELAGGTIEMARGLNEATRTLPLPRYLQILPVGQWFSSKTITVSLKQGQRVALFDLSGVADTTRNSVTASDTPAAKTSQPAIADLSVARTIQFPIYNLYHVKLGLGFVYSTAPNNRFQVSTVTIGSGSSATTEKFIDQTVSRNYTILGTANIMIFPYAQHAFPWRPRYVGEKKPTFIQDLAPMVGFSITSPTKDFVFGGAWFPRTSPVGLQLGWHLALRDYPPNGLDLTQPVTSRVIVFPQKRVNGFFVGLVFTTDFFGKALAPIFKQ